MACDADSWRGAMRYGRRQRRFVALVGWLQRLMVDCLASFALGVERILTGSISQRRFSFVARQSSDLAARNPARKRNSCALETIRVDESGQAIVLKIIIDKHLCLHEASQPVQRWPQNCACLLLRSPGVRLFSVVALPRTWRLS